MSDLLRQFIPLSLSDLIMVLAGPIIIAGLTRLPGQEIHLAAYGVAEAMAVLIESPIIMLLHASTALSRDAEAFRALKRFMILANVTLTALYAVLAFSPLYDGLFQGLLGQPPAVAAAARPAFQVMLLWPAAIGWRRFYQGLLITRKRSSQVGLASAFRLASLALMVVIGVSVRLPGALVAGSALVTSVIVEAAAVTVYARRALRMPEPPGTNPGHSGDGGASIPRTVGSVARWYIPLAVTAILIWASKPGISGGIARAAQPELSLAAWPAVWTTVMLVANATRMIQQLIITQANSPENYRVLVRFTLWAGLIASAIMALIGLSPAGGALLTQVTGLSGNLAAAATPALRICVLYPLGIALQNHLEGLLIRKGRTGAVNLAAICASGVLFLAMVAGVRTGWTGTVVGATATMAGQVVEVAILWRLTAPERAALTRPDTELQEPMRAPAD